MQLFFFLINYFFLLFIFCKSGCVLCLHVSPLAFPKTKKAEVRNGWEVRPASSCYVCVCAKPQTAVGAARTQTPLGSHGNGRSHMQKAEASLLAVGKLSLLWWPSPWFREKYRDSPPPSPGLAAVSRCGNRLVGRLRATDPAAANRFCFLNPSFSDMRTRVSVISGDKDVPLR